MTLEIPRDDIGRHRKSATDDELIDFGVFLRRTAGDDRDVAVVTWGMGLDIRARRAGLRIIQIPDKYDKDEQAAVKGQRT